MDVLGGVLAARLEQQHSEQLTTRKNVTRPPNEAIYHTSDHGSTTRLFSERKRIDAKCQFRFPHSGRKRQVNNLSLVPLQRHFLVQSSRSLFVTYNKVRRHEMVSLLFGYLKTMY